MMRGKTFRQMLDETRELDHGLQRAVDEAIERLRTSLRRPVEEWAADLASDLSGHTD